MAQAGGERRVTGAVEGNRAEPLAAGRQMRRRRGWHRCPRLDQREDLPSEPELDEAEAEPRNGALRQRLAAEQGAIAGRGPCEVPHRDRDPGDAGDAVRVTTCRTRRDPQIARRDVRHQEGDVGLDRAGGAPGDAAAVGLEAAALDGTVQRNAGGALTGDAGLEIAGQQGIVDETGAGGAEQLPPAEAGNRDRKGDDLEIGAVGEGDQRVARAARMLAAGQDGEAERLVVPPPWSRSATAMTMWSMPKESLLKESLLKDMAAPAQAPFAMVSIRSRPPSCEAKLAQTLRAPSCQPARSSGWKTRPPCAAACAIEASSSASINPSK